LFPINNTIIISIVISSILKLLMYFNEIKIQLLQIK
jgi:hypothetical protein